MKKSNYTFEVHVYAPELNKVYLNGLNVTKYFEKIKKDLTKDFASNIRLIRKTLNYKTYNHYCAGKYYSQYGEKNFNGGFNNWYEAIDTFRMLKSWFTKEKPKLQIKFKY